VIENLEHVLALPKLLKFDVYATGR